MKRGGEKKLQADLRGKRFPTRQQTEQAGLKPSFYLALWEKQLWLKPRVSSTKSSAGRYVVVCVCRTQAVVEEVEEHQHAAAHDHEHADHDGGDVHRLLVLLLCAVVPLVLHVASAGRRDKVQDVARWRQERLVDVREVSRRCHCLCRFVKYQIAGGDDSKPASGGFVCHRRLVRMITPPPTVNVYRHMTGKSECRGFKTRHSRPKMLSAPGLVRQRPRLTMCPQSPWQLCQEGQTWMDIKWWVTHMASNKQQPPPWWGCGSTMWTVCFEKKRLIQLIREKRASGNMSLPRDSSSSPGTTPPDNLSWTQHSELSAWNVQEEANSVSCNGLLQGKVDIISRAVISIQPEHHYWPFKT